MHAAYTPLDRSRNEIRLLRILPPEQIETSDSFEFSTEPLKCRLEHASLDLLYGIKAAQTSQIVDYILGPDIEGGRRQVAHAQFMSRLIPERASREWISPNRKARIETILEDWYGRLLSYLPLDALEDRPDFDLWAKRWIWKPLSGHDFPDTHRDGYFALSYVWGDQTLRREIEVDNGIVEVGQSLYEALRALREIPEVQMGTPVWIDALCINQQDIEERNHEVRRMGDIYTRALRVISYLGDEKDYSHDGIDFLNFLSLKDTSFLSKLGDLWLENPDMVSGQPGSSICDILTLPYWSRVWILQEIFLSRPGSILIIGARKMHTRNLLQAMEIFHLLGRTGKDEIWLRGKPYTAPEVRALEAGVLTLVRTRTLVMHSLDVADNGRPILLDGNLLVVLKILHQNACSAQSYDIRDRVYGQLTLLDNRISDLVAVNYAKETTFLHVMASLAVAIINGVHRLDWIHCTWAIVLEDDSWPSWVPDFRVGKDGHHYRWASQPGDASKSDCQDVEIDVERMILNCPGYRLGVVAAATGSIADMILGDQEQDIAKVEEDSLSYLNWENHPGMPDRIAGPAILRKTLHHASQRRNISSASIVSSETHKYGDHQGLQKALRSCFERIGWSVGGINIMDIPWELDDVVDFSTLSIYDGARSPIVLEVFRELNKEFSFWDRTFREIFPSFAADDDLVKYSEFVLNMQWGDKVLSQGRLIVTQNGYVGSVICDILPGDEVVILKGCKLPVVLRRFGNRYRLVGSAYIHGIMDGEAIARVGRELKDVETFVVY